MARVGYERWQVAGLALTAGAVALGVGAALRWHFPDTRIAIVGTWVTGHSTPHPGGLTFKPNGRDEHFAAPGGPHPPAGGRYEVSRGGGSVRFIPDAGPEYRIRVEFAGRDQFIAAETLPARETTGVSFYRR